MANRTQTYYEALGIPPNAKHNDVGLAFNRRMAALRRPDVPPDPKGEARLKEAFEVLSDLDRRAAYDEQLRKARLKPAFGRNHAALAALFVVAIAAGLYRYLRPQIAPELVALEVAPPGKPYQEVLATAIPAIGRLQAVEMSGAVQPSGLAFAVEEGILVTSCKGLSPTAQLSVNMAPRVVPARVVRSDDALGICMLEVPGAGSWPLPVNPVAPKAGDRVYAAHLTPGGEVMLRESQVKSVKAEGAAAIVDVSTPLPPEHSGAPLLDIEGRVMAFATMPPGAKGRYVVIPAAWREMPKYVPSFDRPREEAPAETEAKGEPIDELGVPLETRRKQEELARKIDPQRRQRLEKAFRPPPSVPDDL